MARLRRRSVDDFEGSRGLTPRQRWDLLYGFSPNGLGGVTFKTPAQYQAGWRQHRDSLMHVLGLFRRPEAYWAIEHEFIPGTGGNHESQRSALIRLGAVLTSQEQGMLTDDERAALTGLQN